MSIFKKDPSLDTEKLIMEVTKGEALSIFSERDSGKFSLGTWMVYIAAGLMVVFWLFLGENAPSYSICLPVAAMIMLFVHAMIGIKKTKKAARAAYSEHRAL